MSAAMAGGLVLDLILAGMGLEALVLVALHRARGRGVPPAALLPNLASGMCVLLAMRLGLTGIGWGWVSAALLAALGFHLLELRRNWR